MKKRLLLILAIGIAFAPTVFADTGISPAGKAAACGSSGITGTKSLVSDDSASAQTDTKQSGNSSSGSVDSSGG